MRLQNPDRTNPITNFDISFLKEGSIYSGGQNLAGHVTLQNDRPIVIERLHISFKGVAVVLWKKALDAKLSKTNPPPFSADDEFFDFEEYLNQKLTLCTKATPATPNLLVPTPQLAFCSPPQPPPPPPSVPYPSSLSSQPSSSSSSSSASSSSSSSPNYHFAPGKQSFPFSVQLPDFLPYTFNGSYGFVKYTAQAVLVVVSKAGNTLEKSGKTDVSKNKSKLGGGSGGSGSGGGGVGGGDDNGGEIVMKVSKEFTIRNEVLFSEKALLPVEKETNKQFQFIGLTLSDVRGRWKINKTGFFPGEEIEIHADISNLGRLKVLETKATLVQHISYTNSHCPESRILQRKKLASKRKSSINTDECSYWREKMQIPLETTPTTNKIVGLIDIRYTLKLSIKLVPPLKPIKSEVDVIIGNLEFPEDAINIFQNKSSDPSKSSSYNNSKIIIINNNISSEVKADSSSLALEEEISFF